jgi:hypothetical protein
MDAIDRTELAGAKPGPVVIDNVSVHRKIQGVRVLSVGPQHINPRRPRQFESPQQVAADIRRAFTLSARPGRSRRPIAGQPPPGSHGSHTETGMRLGLVDILGSPHRDQRRSGQILIDERHRIGDRKRVAIEKHQQILIRCLLRDLHGEMIQLAGMRATLVNYPVEVNRISRVDMLKRRPSLIGNRDVPLQVPRLDLDPPRRQVMHRGNVKHYVTRTADGRRGTVDKPPGRCRSLASSAGIIPQHLQAPCLCVVPGYVRQFAILSAGRARDAGNPPERSGLPRRPGSRKISL